ncbi:MAG: hypothetical protein OXH99_05995 [Bryobacterales bacterium]|nr:hypothetical protein [Bryobacterales bacterium]
MWLCTRKTLAAEQAREELERARQRLPARSRQVPEGTFDGLAGRLRAVWEDRATSWSNRKRLLTSDREVHRLHVLLRWRGGVDGRVEITCMACHRSALTGMA